MSIDPHHIEMIDAYLTGQLSPEDSARLMQSLEQDPALKEEFLLQQSTVKALQEHRRKALKARLDAIEVGSGYSFTSSAGFKMVAGTALVALLGTAAYFGFTEWKDAAPVEQAINISEGEKPATPSVPEEEIPAKPEPQKADELMATEELTTAKADTENTPSANTPSAFTTTTTEPTAVTSINKEVEKGITEPAPATAPAAANAEVIKPDIVTDFEEKDITAHTPEVEVPEDQLTKVHSFDKSTISVSTKSGTRYNFHYRFFDNQLQIFGDFSKVPYEVLEVNTGLSTSYFLYHKERYYELKPNQEKVTRLQELIDKKTIKELEITRTEKLNK
ncbi:anti-sigma factor family protein [Nafulsella turpanensis]|uniref:anti-sigma factor family protein n=1 Tax=Nafulsella turpanensis TaxID=1265690 RepID=UPI000344F980|nr:hypothetical protein [Nafulsella turpanensis]